MRQDEELWIKKMKEIFSEYSEPSPPDGWSKLEKELLPKKRIYPLKWWGAAAAVLILALSGVGILLMNESVINDIKYTSLPELVSVPDRVSTQPQPDLLSLDSEPLSSLSKRNNIEQIIKQKNPLRQYTDIIPDNVDETTRKENLVDDNKQDKSLEKKSDEKEETRHRPSDKDKYHLPVENSTIGKSSSTQGWSMGLAVNSGTASLNSFSGNEPIRGNLTMNAVDVPDLSSNGMIVVPDDEAIILRDNIPYVIKTNEIVDIKHHQPISFGVSIRKGLTNRLSLESGLMYTLLSSDVKLSSAPSTSIDQKLHYIGIPLKANWDFINSQRFVLYASAGGAVEKCIYGKTGSKKNTVDELQFSLLGGVGAQYNATNKIGFYVEPGVSYFFDDGSNVETIRKDKPFNINLQAGIRFTY